MQNQVSAVNLDTMSKKEKYLYAIEQIKAVTADENNLIANLANCSAILHSTFGWWWTGFYLVKDKQLVLGPFQGPVACTRIHFGKGVCGRAWELGETVIVEDVESFPGHIACSAESKSEIVVPVIKNGTVLAVLDSDSAELSFYNHIDKQYLEEVCNLVSGWFSNQ